MQPHITHRQMKEMIKQVEVRNTKKPVEAQVKGKIQELNPSDLKEIEGGIIPFVLGYAVGVLMGAGGVYAGYHIIKSIER